MMLADVDGGLEMTFGNRILMVNNDSEYLHERARSFAALGFTVTTARSSVEAIELTARGSFDLAEIDLDPKTAANLRCYLEQRYRSISIFILSRGTCRSGPRRPPSWPERRAP